MKWKRGLHLFFVVLSIAGLALSIYSLASETWRYENKKTFKDILYIGLFSFFGWQSYSRYKRAGREKITGNDASQKQS